MAGFASFDGTEIRYELRGEGPPVLLLHGFAADGAGNWDRPGVVDALVAAGRRVVLPDARGHGASGKPHDPAAYADEAMVRDARGLLDHLGIDAVDVAGYSMGAMVAARLALADPRLRSLVLGGVGAGLLRPRPETGSERIAAALLADDPRSIEDRTARAFRRFADSTGADRHALAAIQRSRWASQRGVDLSGLALPVLVVAGADDTLVGSPAELAAAVPGARLRTVRGDHLTAVTDPEFARAIVDFLAEVDALRRAGR